MDFSLEELELSEQADGAASDHSDNPFDVLGLSYPTTMEQVRASYIRLRNLYSATSDSAYSLFEPDEIEYRRKRLDAAYQALSTRDGFAFHSREVEKLKVDTSCPLETVKGPENFGSEYMPGRGMDSGKLSNISTREPIQTATPVNGPKGILRPRAEGVGDKQFRDDLLHVLGCGELNEGAALRQLREVAGIDLTEVSHNLKFSEAMIDAIESMDPARLPAFVFVKGYMKSFFKYIGLDAQPEFICKYEENLKSV